MTILASIMDQESVEVVTMWTDIVFLAYTHLHFLLIFWLGGSAGDIKALVVLNLVTIFVVDLMSVVTTLNNKEKLTSYHIKVYILSMVVLNLCWVPGCWVISKEDSYQIMGGNEDEFEPNLENNGGVGRRSVSNPLFITGQISCPS